MMSFCTRSGTRERHGERILRVVLPVLALGAAFWLAYETYRFAAEPVRLFGRTIHPGAIDLKIFQRLAQAWFSGEENFYERNRTAFYPPASYPVFWLLTGWVPIAAAKVLWAVTAALCLGWLVRLCARESRGATPSARALGGLLPVALYATGGTVGNGQLGIHVLALLVAGLLLLRPDPRAIRGGAGALFILLALVKPNIAAPFFWIALFVPGTLWPAALAAGGYLALTIFSAAFQHPLLPALIASWWSQTRRVGASAGESNFHFWLSGVGLESWATPVALLFLLVLGWWVYRHRCADIWLLAGVSAVVARLWTYHRWYDDLVLLFLLLSLLRTSRSAPPGRAEAARTLFALTFLSLLAPGGLYLLPQPWKLLYLAAQNLIWAAGGAFLVWETQREATSKRFMIASSFVQDSSSP